MHLSKSEISYADSSQANIYFLHCFSLVIFPAFRLYFPEFKIFYCCCLNIEGSFWKVDFCYASEKGVDKLQKWKVGVPGQVTRQQKRDAQDFLAFFCKKLCKRYFYLVVSIFIISLISSENSIWLRNLELYSAKKRRHYLNLLYTFSS